MVLGEGSLGTVLCWLLASCVCTKRGNIGFHNLMKLRGEINMVDRSSNQPLEFITCKSLQQEQSMKCQLALQQIPNNSIELGILYVASSLNKTL